MRIQTFLSLILIVILFIIGWGCVDVPSQGQLPPDYHALARFINVATDAAPGPVTIDGSLVGSPAFGVATSYIDFPAGGRKAVFASVSQTVDLRSQSQNSVLVIPLSNGDRFLVLDEGYNFTNNGKPGVASVRFVNAAQGSAPQLTFTDSSLTGAELKSGVGYLAVQPYTDLPPGGHMIYVLSNGSYLSAIDGAHATPATASTTTGTATITINPVDGLTYSISLSTSVKDSFYTMAHFHFGAPGSNGANFLTIPVDTQTITFPTLAISGAKAVPPDTAIASGAGTLVLTRLGLDYSFDLFTDTTYQDTQFISGALRNAAVGAVGPVVRKISDTTGHATISGTWTSADPEPLTDPLITELLAGRIYVSFVTNNGQEIRAQLTPDNVTASTYVGSLATVPDSVRDSINAGHVYINFHTAAVPGGIVRGQVTTDPAGGQLGVGSLPSVNYAAGHRYTVIATGRGKSLGLHQFGERQYGLSKEAVRTTSTPVHKIP
jgi:hypothetical protein